MTQQFNNTTTTTYAPFDTLNAPLFQTSSRKSSLDQNIFDPAAKPPCDFFQEETEDQLVSLDLTNIYQSASLSSPDHPLEEEQNDFNFDQIQQEQPNNADHNNFLLLPQQSFFDQLAPPNHSTSFMNSQEKKKQQQFNQFAHPLQNKKIAKQSVVFSFQKKKQEPLVNQKPGKKTKNYDKNICRYLTRVTIRCFAKLEYQEQVLKYTRNNYELYSNSTEYFVRRIEQITGFRALKEYLNPSQEMDPEVREYKKVFKQFYQWFLKERIARYIMNGKMDDKLMYIKYKNEVMLKYADSLDKWTSNKNKKKNVRAGINKN